ncbi:cytochrome-c peroxidase [Owenweeksia hongkongensis]|uniref:cytochrome-c peroxidase n=1 Tax=Owenweeksia hongkongensis TaxID=253245 RepID=UPI003A9322AD
MNKKFLVLVIIAFVTIGMQFSFMVKNTTDDVRNLALTYATEMLKATEKLEITAQAFSDGEVDVESFRQAVFETRKVYKQNEFLLEYFYPITVKGQINGAPLPHLDPYFPRPVIHEPTGLQTIDEIAFSEEIDENKDELVKLSHDVNIHYRNLYRDFKNHPFLDREVFEAARFEIIRIFTLGVSGFDTPGSLNGIEESKSALEALRDCFEKYTQDLDKEDKNVGKNTIKLFDGAIEAVSNNTDFNEFDRLAFLKEYIDPLFTAILDLQLALNIETINETTSLKQSTNYFARSIFDEDFLNPYYYTRFGKNSDNPKLRELGKKLFYETRLSADGRGSCASCHHPDKAFTDGQPKSKALNGDGELLRNAPTLLNSAYAKRFFLDMRAMKLEDQVEHVVINPKEFHTSFPNMFKTIEEDSIYKNMFTMAFPEFAGKQMINKTTVSQALASYMISLKSFNSPFDKYVRGETDHIDESVKRGFNLFMGKAACGTCHFAPTFAGLAPPMYQDSESEVLGVLKNPKAQVLEIDTDRGRGVNKNPMEEVWFYDMSFKTVTVRNVEFTGPYFHNGAYETLEEVLEFYNNGGAVGLGLDLDHQTLAGDSLKLEPSEVQDIISFMKSLSDVSSFQEVNF